MKITTAHIRAAKLCGRGLVNRMKALGMSDEKIMDALQNGMEEEEVRSYNVPMMERVIAIAHKMEAEKNR